MFFAYGINRFSYDNAQMFGLEVSSPLNIIVILDGHSSFLKDVSTCFDFYSKNNDFGTALNCL